MRLGIGLFAFSFVAISLPALSFQDQDQVLEQHQVRSFSAKNPVNSDQVLSTSETLEPAETLKTAETAARNFDLRKQVQTYRARYGLPDAFAKLTDNLGNGYEDLYGTRNVRTVLHGVYYRGGANNAFSKIEKRPNQNPLPDGGLYNLCQQGFSEAIYLYEENFNTAPALTQCVSMKEPNRVEYQQVSGLRRGNERQLLSMIFDHIKGVKPGPVYAHCWNGWHASGYVAAISLQQFCRWTPERARAYWLKNTDGNNVGYKVIEDRILAFQSFNEFEISDQERSLICP